MLTDTQKQRVRTLLGVPALYHDAFHELGGQWAALTPEAETQIGELLMQIATIDAALLSNGVSAAGVSRVDEIWFQDGAAPTAKALKAMGRTYVGQLAIVLGVEPYRDYYGSIGARGGEIMG